MPSDRGRAGAVLLCLLAVVLASVLVPVAGLGTAPAGGPFGPPPGADSGGTAPSDGSNGPDAAPTTADDPATDRPTATPTETETTAEPTATPTETTAEASVPEEEPSSGTGDGLTKLLVGVVVVAAVVVGALALLTRRSVTRGTFGRGTGTPRGGVAVISGAQAAAAGTGRALTALPRATMRFVVGASGSVPRLFDAVGGAVGEAARGLRVAFGGLGSSLGSALFALPAGLVGSLHGLGGLGGAGGLRSSLGGLFDDGTEFSEDRPADDARTATDVAPEASDDGREPPASIAEAWERLVETAPVRRPATKTPVEIARTAVDGGLPPEPVGRLTNLFRRVRYGGETDDDALATARESLAAIRDGDGGEGS